MRLKHGAPRASGMTRKRRHIVAFSRRVKHGPSHLFVVVLVGVVLVLCFVINTGAMLLTDWMRCARALGRGRSLAAVKTSRRTTTSARKPQFTLPLFILVSFRDLPNANA